MDWLLGELQHPHAVAIGETGLDYHYEPEAAELQQQSFRLHLEAARLTGKPVIVHTREARADTLVLLREASLPQAGVLHCFTEDWEMARAALDLGFYISLSGIVTFRNADALRDVARQVLPIACWWRPIRPISHRFPTVARPICRSTCARWPSSWRSCGCFLRTAGGADHRQLQVAFSACPGSRLKGRGFRACNLPDLPRAAHFVLYPQGGVMTAETLHTGPLQRGLKNRHIQLIALGGSDRHRLVPGFRRGAEERRPVHDPGLRHRRLHRLLIMRQLGK